MTEQTTRDEVREYRAKQNQVATQLLHRKPVDHGMLTQPTKFEARSRALELLANRMSNGRTGNGVVAIEQLRALFHGMELGPVHQARGYAAEQLLDAMVR